MYSAIHDQLKAPHYEGLSVDDLRKKTSNYIREHDQDFLPFMTSKNTGDMLTPGKLYFLYFCMVELSQEVVKVLLTITISAITSTKSNG